MISAIDAGTVWVNNYVALSNSVPFGGMKASGFGRELGVMRSKHTAMSKRFTGTTARSWTGRFPSFDCSFYSFSILLTLSRLIQSKALSYHISV